MEVALIPNAGVGGEAQLAGTTTLTSTPT